MTAWTTTLIPAYTLAVGDKVTIGPVTAVLDTVERWSGEERVFGVDVWVTTVHCQEPITVHVPDEPVDGYPLWKPPLGHWPSGCTCVSRRHPEWAGNWDIVHRDPDCRGHYDNDWED